MPMSRDRMSLTVLPSRPLACVLIPMPPSTPKSHNKATPRQTTVVLVRHGQTGTTGQVLPGRARGLHLADEGRAQADLAASLIAAGPDIAAVYTSPLERARETAAPIAT